MTKKKRKRIVLLIVLVLIIAVIGGLYMKKHPIKSIFAENNTSGINGFYYSYDGTIGGNNYSISIKKDADKYILEYITMEYRDYGTMTMELDQQFIDELDLICQNNKVCKWNGFSGHDKNVCDGDGFSLRIKYNDEGCVECDGMNSYPSGYWDYIKQVKELFEDKLNELKEQKRQEMIDKGINGKLDSVMFNINQHGDSGNDEFSIMIMSSKYRENNIDVSFKNTDEQIYKTGKFRYYGKMADEDIDFEALQKIIEKYSIIEWYNYEKTAVDYNNCEWFQISFGFDDNFDINALGTEHPQNYQQFRDEFLKALLEIVDKGVADGTVTAR